MAARNRAAGYPNYNSLMRVLGLDHVNITGPFELLERVRDFYVDVLGLVDGPRPQFRSRGFWLYAGDAPILHLSERDGETSRTPSVLDHFALASEGLNETIAKLGARDIAFEVNPAREGKHAQIFVKDPAGITLELNFR